MGSEDSWKKSRTKGFLEKEETSYNKLSNKDSFKKMFRN